MPRRFSGSTNSETRSGAGTREDRPYAFLNCICRQIRLPHPDPGRSQFPRSVSQLLRDGESGGRAQSLEDTSVLVGIVSRGHVENICSRVRVRYRIHGTLGAARRDRRDNVTAVTWRPRKRTVTDVLGKRNLRPRMISIRTRMFPVLTLGVADEASSKASGAPGCGIRGLE